MSDGTQREVYKHLRSTNSRTVAFFQKLCPKQPVLHLFKQNAFVLTIFIAEIDSGDPFLQSITPSGPVRIGKPETWSARDFYSSMACFRVGGQSF